MIEWRGHSLQGKSYQDVAEIIAESKHEADVELIVSRSMGSRRAAQVIWKQSMAYRGTRPVRLKSVLRIIEISDTKKKITRKYHAFGKLFPFKTHSTL